MSITQVQSKGVAGITGTSASVTLTSNIALSNCIVVTYSFVSAGTITVSSITDNLGNNYNAASYSPVNYDTGLATVALSINPSAPITVTGSCTITINFSTTVSACSLNATEYHSTLGNITSDANTVLIGSGTGNGSNVSMACSVNPTFNHGTELLVSAMGFVPAGNGMLTDPSAPWIQRFEDNNSLNTFALSVGDVVAATNGTAIPTWTNGFTNLTPYFWGTFSRTLYEASAAPPLGLLITPAIACQIFQPTEFAE